MKTPRKVLLEHHRSAQPSLDEIRQRVVSDLAPHVPKPSVGVMTLLWTELILPCRRVWAGLAVVWVVILVLNFEGRAGLDEASRTMASELSPQSVAILVEQWRLRDELLMVSKLPPAVRGEKPVFRPRSERRISFLAT